MLSTWMATSGIPNIDCRPPSEVLEKAVCVCVHGGIEWNDLGGWVEGCGG
jgi:hypothetical protein